MPEPTWLLELQGCRVDLDLGVVHRGAEDLRLTTKELEALVYLSQRPGAVVSREALHEAVWGMSEKVVSRAADNILTRLRAKVEDNPRKPRHLLTVYGGGYRFVPLERAPKQSRRMPAETDPFVGRAAELARLEQALSPGARVTIVGPGGAGKTRLAIRAASRFRGSTVFCPLTTVHDEPGVWAALARAVDSGDSGDGGVRSAIAAVQRARIELLVLDTAEHVVEAVRAVVGALGDGPTVLVTSRRPMELPGEEILPLGPLLEADAVELLRLRASQEPWAGSARTEASELVRRLDGLPLAIELAAARMGVLTPRHLLDRLDDRIRLLDTNAERTLTHTLAWSWSLLSPSAQHTLACVSLFEGPFEVDAAEAVCDAPVATVHALEELRRHSLLRLPDPADRRFVLFDAARAFAALRCPPEAAPRLVAWYVARAPGWRAHAETDPGARRRLAAEQAHLRTAWRLAAPADRPELALAASPLLGSAGALESWVRMLDDTLLATPLDELRLARTEALRILGRVEETEAELRALGDRPGRTRGIAMAQLSPLLRITGRLPEAEAVARTAVDALDAVGEPRWAAIARSQVGSAAARAGRTEEARGWFEAASRALRKGGFARNLAIVQGNLGVLHIEAGRFAEAEACLTDALAVQEAWGDRRNALLCRHNLATVWLQTGEDARAAEAFEALAEDHAARGDPHFSAMARCNQGLACLALGAFGPGERALWTCLQELETLGDRATAAQARGHLGVARLLRGRTVEGEGDLTRAATEARAAGVTALADLFDVWVNHLGRTPPGGGGRAGGPTEDDPLVIDVQAALRGEPVRDASPIEVRLAIRYATRSTR